MKYEVRIQMKANLDSGSFDSPEERFQSAVSCTKKSISSILYDYSVLVDCAKSVITITAEEPNLFTVNELQEMLKPALCDGDSITYPEFDLVSVNKI